MEKKALILGATGLIGSHLVNELIENGQYKEIILLARRKTDHDHPGVKTKIIDFNRMEDHFNEFKDKDVFWCLGTTRKKAGSKEAFQRVDYEYPLSAAQLTAREGGKKFFLVSAMGADKDSPFFYNRVKGNLEEDIKSLPIPSIYIFRPSLLIGDREEFRFGEKMAEWLFKPLNPLLRGKMLKYKPIKAQKVAKVMTSLAKKEVKGIHILESDSMQK